jgi:hypothetical protein
VGASFKEEITNVGSIEDCKQKCEQRVEDGVAECRSIVYFTIKKTCYILEEPYDATGRGVDYTFQYAKMSEYFNSYMTSYGGECGKKAQCSTIAKAVGFCGSKVYDSSRASNTCAASACSSGTPADISACCSPKAQCSSIAGKAGWCGSGKVYNANAARTECAGKACANPTDVAKCCDSPVTCSTIASTSGFCGSGKLYDDTKKGTSCTVAPCQGATTSTKADVSKCCADKAKCSSVFANPECKQPSWGSSPKGGKTSWGSTGGWTRMESPAGKSGGHDGFTYHTGPSQSCAQSSHMWGTHPLKACEYGFCPDGYTENIAGMTYVGSTKKLTAGKSFTWDPWAPPGGSPSGMFYVDTCPCKSDFCGKSGKGYNSAAANAYCAGTACSSSTASDVTACCSARATCSTIASNSGFCGAGKVYNSAAADLECAAAVCASPADVGACCTAP